MTRRRRSLPAAMSQSVMGPAGEDERRRDRDEDEVLHHVQRQEGAVVGGDRAEDGEQHQRKATEESRDPPVRDKCARVRGLRSLAGAQVPGRREGDEEDGNRLDREGEERLRKLRRWHARPCAHPDPASTATVSGAQGNCSHNARDEPAKERQSKRPIGGVDRGESRRVHASDHQPAPLKPAYLFVILLTIEAGYDPSPPGVSATTPAATSVAYSFSL